MPKLRSVFLSLCLLSVSCSDGSHGGPTEPTQVSSVLIAPNAATLNPGDTQQLTATLMSSGGALLTGRTITWTTSNRSIADVDATGTVTAGNVGVATITATSGGKSATARITVELVAVASIQVLPNPSTIAAGTAVQLSATLRDAGGNVLPGRVLTWSSSDTAVARVSSTGLVSGVSFGNAVIAAAVEGVEGSAAVSVVLVGDLSFTLEGYFAASVQTSAVRFGQLATVEGVDYIRVYVLPNVLDATGVRVVLQTGPVRGWFGFLIPEPTVGRTYDLETACTSTRCSFTQMGLEKEGDPPFTTSAAITSGTLTIDSLTVTRMTGRFSADLEARLTATGELLGTFRILNGRFSVPRPQ